ncbi:MAG: hypothetical protein HY077_17125 [Elusimicrobia bacterium]|nr:hypothetical protein [Elusimicrobiota bacterium]
MSLAAILDQAKSERDDSSDHWDKLVDEDASAAEQVTAQAASWDAWRAKVDAERKAHEDALAAIEAARDPQWEALSEWVGRACSYIKPAEFVHDGIGSSTPDFEYIKWAAAENDRRAAGKHASDAADREYLLTHSVVLPKSVIERGLKAHKSSLGSCEKDIIGLLLAAPAPVRSEWLVDEIDYLKGGGALGIVVRGIAKGLKKGSEALVTGIAVPFIAVGNAIEELSVELSKPVAPSRSEPGGSDRPQRPERSESGGSRDVWHGSGAYGQLGGISSGGLTFH